MSVWVLDCARGTRRLAKVAVPKRGFVSFDGEGDRLEMNAGACSADTALTACNLHLRSVSLSPRLAGERRGAEPVTERLDGDLILKTALAIDSLLPDGALRKAVRAYEAAVTSPEPAAVLRGLFDAADSCARTGNRPLSGDDLDAELSRLTGEGVEWIAERRRAAESADSGELAASILTVRAVTSNLLLRKLENDTVYNRWDETGARLADWLRGHQEIPGTDKLLAKLTKALDNGRYKMGHVYHALLVEQFHEDGTFEVTEVEPDFGPKTDVDFILNGDIRVQVWAGKPSVDHAMDETRGLRPGVDWNEWIVLDQAEYSRIAKKKMGQLPKAGKRFLLNVLPGHAMRHYTQIHSICDADSCFIEMTIPHQDYATAPHATVYGSDDFRHRDLVCRMIHAIDPRRAVNFVLGEWGHGIDKWHKAHGIDVSSRKAREFHTGGIIHGRRDEMLAYAEKWYPGMAPFLRGLATESIRRWLIESRYREKSDCRCGKYAGTDK